MWQLSKKDEDSPDTHVVYSFSEDNGKSWAKPMNLSTPVKDNFCTTGGWLQTSDTLIAFINALNSENFKKNGGMTFYKESKDGINWTEQQKVKMDDGSHLNGMFEQDPHILPDGRLVNAALFQPG